MYQNIIEKLKDKKSPTDKFGTASQNFANKPIKIPRKSKYPRLLNWRLGVRFQLSELS
jgi:hypothetical protein